MDGYTRLADADGPPPASTSSQAGDGPEHHHRPLVTTSYGSPMSFPDLRTVPGRPVFRQKKGRLMRWLSIDSQGNRQVFMLDKRMLTQAYGLDIPARDMRLMDAALGSEAQGQLLIRDNAMVFRMEHISMIITADKVIIPIDEAERNELKERFVQTLEAALQERLQEEQPHPTGRGSEPGDGCRSFYHSEEVVPFELQVLETGLGEIVALLAREVSLLHAQTQPALEELTRSAESTNLERVRRIKTAHQRYLGRVTVLRDTLQRIMSDDMDMLRMCLSKQQQQQQQVQAMAAAPPNGNSGSQGTPLPFTPAGTLHQQLEDLPLGSMVGSVTKRSGLLHRRFNHHHRPAEFIAASLPNATRAAQLHHAAHQGVLDPAALAAALDIDDHDIDDVENLLESYYMMVDATYQNLQAIGEYIDDTEDLINIQLDYSRNKLIKFEIMLTTATFSMALFGVVAGVLGENLVLPEAITQDLWGFVLVNGGTMMTCLVIFCSVHAFLRWRRFI